MVWFAFLFNLACFIYNVIVGMNFYRSHMWNWMFIQLTLAVVSGMCVLILGSSLLGR